MSSMVQKAPEELGIIVSGGGTGGHLFPAIAVVRELEKRVSNCRVLFIVGKRGRGVELINGQGYPVAMVDVEGMKGRGLVKVLWVLFRLPWSILQSMGHIKRFAPDIVFGVGGYSAGPVCIAARLKGIPSAIHEQNAVPGLTNRMLARLVDRVFVSFEQTRELLGGSKAVTTGMPIREELLTASEAKKEERGKFTILVVGGSQGSVAINKTFVEALRILKSKGKEVDAIHQTGEADFERTSQDYAAKGLEGEVLPFIKDMAGAYSRADLVICRAGASTIFELAAVKKPAILIPYPYSANHHQDLNAQALADTGGAIVVLEKDMTPELLADHIGQAMDNKESLKQRAAAAGSFARPDAAKVIAENLLDLVAK
ncbi:MAG: undecaprenyldiphospho-muramoylpentapeptide beta-N-acetylglucosaminyltransferase [Deltaproteobacteria bacterium]|nr:MAG: undecaprenyldiphospho-muramoylpentapeptide beta-N-acetylglucosaminyltransferase [Deltaproteobacteria bacterium]